MMRICYVIFTNETLEKKSRMKIRRGKYKLLHQERKKSTSHKNLLQDERNNHVSGFIMERKES